MQLFTLKNKNGMTMRVTDLGGIVLSLTAPDRKGRLEDITLGLDTPEAYQAGHPYFGCLVGRFGNRIAHGKFHLNGKAYSLPLNNTPGGIPCSLHGGNKGFDKVVWNARPFRSPAGEAIEFTYFSADGEEGFPGNLFVRAVYTLTDCNAWRIDYWAMTDADTIVNLTQHAYFNLTGCKRDILGHEMMLNASRYTPTNAGMIPTGAIAKVEGTPMDFRTPHVIGARINDDFEALKFGLGYDHNWIIDRTGEGLALAARVKDPESGRVLECRTTEPAVQFYAGNFLDGTVKGKGHTYAKRYGFCLETQHYPDAPNHPDFPSTVLKPGQVYRQTTVYKFSAE